MELWTVEVTTQMQVWAESEEEARLIGLENAGDEIRDHSADHVSTTKTVRVPDFWLHALPYGGPGDRTCAELMAEQP